VILIKAPPSGLTMLGLTALTTRGISIELRLELTSPLEVFTSTLYMPALGLLERVHSISVSDRVGAGLSPQVAPPREIFSSGSVIGRLVPWTVTT